MNRNKLKTYAPQARRDFIKAVTDRAAYYGLTKSNIEPVTEQGDVAIIAGKPFPRAVVEKRKKLEERIRQQGFEQVMEAIAYTWFNRFVAIRYMELHGYLDHGYRVLSHHEGKTSPEIVEHAEHVELPGLDREKVIELKLEGTKEAELYRMLLVAQCNALHKAMPFLFEWVDDETDLLLPENLLHSDSLIRKLVNEIPEEDWGQIEIIGWLYQFYISEKKEQVIGKVVKSEDIPAATQLFTPNWIVKYMVQNTLGRLWLATYPNSPLRSQMEFYIEPAEQTPEVEAQLRAITPETLNPEEITLLDDACGSGHILIEAYDLFKAIYQERGYRAKDVPPLILERNLFGLEIDDRAAQLAAFALMMKARSDDRKIFDSGVKPNILAIQESKGLNAKEITEVLNAPILKAELPPRETLFEEIEEAKAPLFSRKNLSIRGEISDADVTLLLDLFQDGKTFGSLIRVPEELAKKLPGFRDRIDDVLAHGDMYGKAAAKAMMPIVKQAQVLAGNYHAVVTNPPYMNHGYLDSALKTFVDKNYPIGKGDLYGCFILRDTQLTKKNGFIGMITIPNWMFLASFEKLRSLIVSKYSIESFIHNGRGIWGSDFGSCSFVMRNTPVRGHRGLYRRLFEKFGSVSTVDDLEQRFFEVQNYLASLDDFDKIPGRPIAYWVSKKILEKFGKGRLNSFLGSGGRCKTHNDEIYLRKLWEVSLNDIGLQKKWCQIFKGGEFRRYFGNREYVINWSNEAKKHYLKVGGLTNEIFWDKIGITWTIVTARGGSSFRLKCADSQYSSVSPTLFARNSEDTIYFLCLLNSVVSSYLLELFNPTFALNVGNVLDLPLPETDVPNPAVIKLGTDLIRIAEEDWNTLETSLDFKRTPLLSSDFTEPNEKTLENAFHRWETLCAEKLRYMQELETENNRLFIHAYGLESQMTPEIPEDQITVYRADQDEDVKRLISYAIGCMMGRYSLDKPGLIYAHSGNKGFDPSQYKSYPADADGIISATETEWFEDDAGNRIVEFIGVAWPQEHMEENLKFVAENLSPNRGESSRETIRRYLATGFFKHHLSMYKKRPIYWLFSSGKQRTFQCLVYLHRYNEGTLSRMRTEYVVPLQGKISARIDQLVGDIGASTSTSHRKKLEKERDKLLKQQAELRTFDEKLRHYADQRISLDLDDGVKVNYGKFGDLLAEVETVTGQGVEE